MSLHPEMPKVDWAVGMVLSAVGIDKDKASYKEITLARNALERCYYIDRAADEMIVMLGGRAYWTNDL